MTFPFTSGSSVCLLPSFSLVCLNSLHRALTTIRLPQHIVSVWQNCSTAGRHVIHPIFLLPRPFLQSTPTEWMSGLKDHKTLCQAITVQNYRPPVATKHRTRIPSVSLQPREPKSPLQRPKLSCKSQYRNRAANTARRLRSVLTLNQAPASVANELGGRYMMCPCHLLQLWSLN